MKIFENKTQKYIEDFRFPDINPKKTIFFDIETTGFSPLSSYIYMIGIYYLKDGVYTTTQYLAENINDEVLIIKLFSEFIKSYNFIISFNGDGFDIPFIRQRAKQYNINNPFEGINSIDIFKDIHHIKNMLKLENYKQKTLERFLGIDREDLYTGGDLIKVYNDYCSNHKDEELELLLLHNKEDIEGLLILSELYPYILLKNGAFEVVSFDIKTYTTNNKEAGMEAIIELSLYNPVKLRISAGINDLYMTAYSNKCKLKIPVYCDELKFFYSNYKDYYYLPMEDTAIHKSVAFYVDKNFRTQAKAANCYSKKTGTFLPQYDEIVTPYFKINYNDKITYFEAEEEFLSDELLKKDYAIHIINTICK